MHYIPVSTVDNYWRKLSGTRSQWRIVNKILNNIESRFPQLKDGKEVYPVTDREMNILNLFREGRLNPKSFSTKN